MKKRADREAARGIAVVGRGKSHEGSEQHLAHDAQNGHK